jgi:hypothetical protein
MNAMTNEEVKAFEGKNQWATGICIDEGWGACITISPKQAASS